MPPKLIHKPVSPDLVRDLADAPRLSSYKNKNWYYRNVKGTMAPTVYHDTADEAINAAGL